MWDHHRSGDRHVASVKVTVSGPPPCRRLIRDRASERLLTGGAKVGRSVRPCKPPKGPRLAPLLVNRRMASTRRRTSLWPSIISGTALPLTRTCTRSRGTRGEEASPSSAVHGRREATSRAARRGSRVDPTDPVRSGPPLESAPCESAGGMRAGAESEGVMPRRHRGGPRPVDEDLHARSDRIGEEIRVVRDTDGNRMRLRPLFGRCRAHRMNGAPADSRSRWPGNAAPPSRHPKHRGAGLNPHRGCGSRGPSLVLFR